MWAAINCKHVFIYKDTYVANKRAIIYGISSVRFMKPKKEYKNSIEPH
jgi:hypothetical protein